MVIVYVDLNPRERGVKQANRRVETRRLRPQICAVTPRRQPMANYLSCYQKLNRALARFFQFRYGVRMYLKFVADLVIPLVYATNSGFVYAGRYVIVYKAAITTGFYKVIIQQLFQIL